MCLKQYSRKFLPCKEFLLVFSKISEHHSEGGRKSGGLPALLFDHTHPDHIGQALYILDDI